MQYQQLHRDEQSRSVQNWRSRAKPVQTRAKAEVSIGSQL
jgi:hypothetical protein